MTAETYPRTASIPRAQDASPLSSRRGVAILILLCLVQFMDVLDASILNIALPSIKHDLGFSQQSLQWVINGYILAYGGFLLLGGRMADLLGRRRVLVTGLLVFAGSSLIGGDGPWISEGGSGTSMTISSGRWKSSVIPSAGCFSAGVATPAAGFSAEVGTDF